MKKAIEAVRGEKMGYKAIDGIPAVPWDIIRFLTGMWKWSL